MCKHSGKTFDQILGISSNFSINLKTKNEKQPCNVTPISLPYSFGPVTAQLKKIFMAYCSDYYAIEHCGQKACIQFVL